MKGIRPLRYLAIVALFPSFALLFWMTALMTSNIAGLLIVGVNVHGLSLTSYAGDSARRAPLSLRMFQDAQQDSGGAVAPGPIPSGPAQQSASPKLSASPTPTPTSLPLLTPTPTPIPLPLPTPTPTPTPTPSPSLLPLPLPSILPLPVLP